MLRGGNFMKDNKSADRYEERDLKAVNGWAVLFGGIILYLGAFALTIAAAVRLDAEESAANYCGYNMACNRVVSFYRAARDKTQRGFGAYAVRQIYRNA